MQRLLRQTSRLPGRNLTTGRTLTEPEGETQPFPGLLPLLGAMMAVGVLAGILELGVLRFQLKVLHQAGEYTLRISRHVAWMVPVASTLMVFVLASLAIGLVRAWDGWRRWSGRESLNRTWVHQWAGGVLGILLLLGPLLTVRGLHPLAAIVLAVGAGYQARSWLVRPTPRWNHTACWAGLLGLGLLLPIGVWEWNRVSHLPQRAYALPPRQAPSVLWIVMDTVRADRMSLHGYPRDTTPELARWATRGLTFEAARSAAPWTLPSHITMFTGLWPSEHGARIDRPYHLASPTLAEYLGSLGYATAGFVANTGICSARYGVGRGFDQYVDLWGNHEVSLHAMLANSALGDRCLGLLRGLGLPAPPAFPHYGRRRAPGIIVDAKNWLDQHGRRAQQETSGSHRPFFLFLNFMDVHGPYLPISSTPRLYSADRPLPARSEAIPTAGWKAMQASQCAPPDERVERQQMSAEVTRLLGDLYDDCLRGLDAELGRFLDELQATGRLDNTWVVITSDHGEYIGEHQLFGHACGLHNEVTHVPLVLIPPLRYQDHGDDKAAHPRGRRIRVPVSHRDLPATLSSLLVPDMTHPFPGRSLARHWLETDPQAPDPVLSQLENQPLMGDDIPVDHYISSNALIHEDHVLIQAKDQLPTLHHLHDDPDRLRDLSNEPRGPERVDRLRSILQSILGRPSAQGTGEWGITQALGLGL